MSHQLHQSCPTDPSKNLADVYVCNDNDKKDNEEEYNSDLSVPHNEDIEDNYEDLPKKFSLCGKVSVEDKEEASENKTVQWKPIDISESAIDKIKVCELKEELKKRFEHNR